MEWLLGALYRANSAWQGAPARTVAEYSPAGLMLCFSAGVICLRFLPSLPPTGWIVWLTAIALVASFWRAGIILPICCLVGLYWAVWIASGYTAQVIPVEVEKKDLIAHGTVVGLVTSHSHSRQFEFSLKRLEHAGKSLTSSGLIRLSSYDKSLELATGDRWQFTVRLKQPRSLVNPGMGFDYAAWAASRRIIAIGYVVKGSGRKREMATDYRSELSRSIAGFRARFLQFIHQQSLGREAEAVFSALAIGVRENMGPQTWRVLQHTGTAHLVAISGLHIGLVAILAGFIGSGVWRCAPILQQRLSLHAARWIFALVAASFYAVIAGFPLPARRALAMLFAASALMILRRRAPAGWTLSIVLAVILAIDPLAPLSSSFWLSFTAVAILVLRMSSAPTAAPENVGYWPALLLKLQSVVSGWMAIQFWLFVGMIPVLLVTFQQISLSAPLANLLAVPVIGMLVVPLVLLSMIAWGLGFVIAASWGIGFASHLFEGIWQVLEWMSSSPLSVWQQGTPTTAALVAAASAALFLFNGNRLPWRWLSIFWLLPLFFIPSKRLDNAEFRYVQLDVGQGLASVIHTRNHVLVFDTGASYPSGFNLGQAVVIPYLRSRNVQQIDRLVVSHGDNDHIGGALAVAALFRPRQVIAGDVHSPYLPQPATACARGQKWSWDDVRFEVLWPRVNNRPKGNNLSCVIRVSSKFGSVLLTGDIERQTEQTLLQDDGDRLRSDILQLPHHGSRTSSTRAFIDAVQPQIGLVSSGYLNRFGHPHNQVLKTYQHQGVPVLNTADQGAMTVTIGSTGIGLESERQSHRRFWRDPSPLTDRTRLRVAKPPEHSDILAAE